MVLEAGSARRDVTPDRSVPLAGTFFERLSRGVHDPLYARALVLDDGETAVGHVSIDVISAQRELTRDIRRAVREAGIALDGIMVSTTHTHTGPELSDRHPGGDPDHDLSDVVETIERGASEALVEAAQSRRPATLSVGTATNDGSTINRRSRGGLLGEVDTAGRDVNPAQDVDPELSVLLVEPEAARPVVLYNSPCHTTTLTNDEISADWPRAAAETVRDEWGDAMVSFVNGAAGDIVPRDSYDWQASYDSRIAFATAIGTEIGESVLDALADAERGEPRDDPTIAIRSEDVELRIKAVDREALERRRDELDERIEREGLERENPLGHPVTREQEFVERDLALHALDVDGLPATIQYLEAGPVGVVSLPGEPLVGHGLDLKAAMAVDTPMIAGYTNDHLGYLPTVEEFEHGGYEVLTCKLSPAGIETMRETALGLMDSR